jgi:CspA family cold shock protein
MTPRVSASSPRTKAANQSQGFKSLQENQRVSFDVTSGPKGKQASNIQPL